jgi:rod shape-determining protein MreC
MGQNRENKIYLSVGAVFLIFIIFHYLGWLSKFENQIRATGLPILGTINGFSIKLGDNYQFFKNRDEFITAYEKNISNQQMTETLTADVKRFSEENSELKRQLNYFQKNSYGHLLANVVGRELASSDQVVIIDRGTDDGISEGDPVVVGNGILIGKIFKVEKTISFVRLLNDNVSRVGSTILNHDKSLGVIEGGFGISLKMNLIPRDEVILVNDQVVTSGLENKTPRGLLIGNIAEVENEPYKPFQQAVVSPATDYSKISVVSVLIIK